MKSVLLFDINQTYLPLVRKIECGFPSDDVEKFLIHCLTISVTQSIISFSIFFRLVMKLIMPPASYIIVQHRLFLIIIFDY